MLGDKVERQVLLLGMDGRPIAHRERAEIEVLEEREDATVVSIRECGDHLTYTLGDAFNWGPQ